jgi:hypothetical protein
MLDFLMGGRSFLEAPDIRSTVHPRDRRGLNRSKSRQPRDRALALTSAAIRRLDQGNERLPTMLCN